MPNQNIILFDPFSNDRGVTIPLVAILMVVLVMFVALAVDLGHLYVARNELQNAADAGALAGAHDLYLSGNVTLVNDGANQVAYEAAVANMSQNLAVEVNWTEGNDGDVQRGHWSFATETFTPNNSLVPVNLVGVSTEDLDNDPDFINAVQVTVRRQTTPVESFFAGIFGIDEFVMSARATGYIGFAGTLQPGEIEQPIAICEDSILKDGKYQCNIGRMINSGQDVENNETGGWTSLEQDGACTGGTNAQEVKGLVNCSNTSTAPSVELGKPIATTGGQVESAFKELYDCWKIKSEDGTKPWEMLLPVVTCDGNNITTCQPLVGAVKLKVIWINDAVNVNNPKPEDMPHVMNFETSAGDAYWEADPNQTPLQIWQDFVAAYNLQNVADGSTAPFQQKAIYFLPSCDEAEIKGVTGGKNFGILAKIPVLVK